MVVGIRLEVLALGIADFQVVVEAHYAASRPDLRFRGQDMPAMNSCCMHRSGSATAIAPSSATAALTYPRNLSPVDCVGCILQCASHSGGDGAKEASCILCK